MIRRWGRSGWGSAVAAGKGVNRSRAGRRETRRRGEGNTIGESGGWFRWGGELVGRRLRKRRRGAQRRERTGEKADWLTKRRLDSRGGWRVERPGCSEDKRGSPGRYARTPVSISHRSVPSECLSVFKLTLLSFAEVKIKTLLTKREVSLEDGPEQRERMEPSPVWTGGGARENGAEFLQARRTVHEGRGRSQLAVVTHRALGRPPALPPPPPHLFVPPYLGAFATHHPRNAQGRRTDVFPSQVFVLGGWALQHEHKDKTARALQDLRVHAMGGV